MTSTVTELLYVARDPAWAPWAVTYFFLIGLSYGALALSLPGIVAGAIIMWVTTLAELSSTIVLYYGPWATMTVEIFQRMGSGEFGPASAYATILIVSVLIQRKEKRT